MLLSPCLDQYEQTIRGKDESRGRHREFPGEDGVARLGAEAKQKLADECVGGERADEQRAVHGYLEATDDNPSCESYDGGGEGLEQLSWKSPSADPAIGGPDAPPRRR